MSFGHVDLLWLVAGVVLHLCSQLSRGRGWYAIVCAAHPAADRPRRRDVMLIWVAGAGASGVLSARGGDALRVLLLRRRMTTTCPTLVGTLAAETVAETALGALLTAWALTAGFIPGLHRPTLAGVLLIVSGVLLLLLVIVRAARRFPSLARACTEARRGLALLGSPGRYVRRVASWGVLSRALRIVSLMCLLAAFSLPATLTAALVVMVAHSSGRLVPFGPAGAGASLGLLVAAFPAVTHTQRDRRRGDRVLPRRDRHADRGRHRALRARAGARARLRGRPRRQVGQALERLRVPRKAPVRVPAA